MADYSFKDFGITPKQLESADKESALIEFGTLHTHKGDKFWYYLSIPPSKYPDYKKRHHAGGSLNPKDYGEVLASGWGDLPPQDIIDEMKRLYGCNPSFDEEFKEAIEKEFE